MSRSGILSLTFGGSEKIGSFLIHFYINYQLHSQNAGKVTHIKGRLLDQAEILFNCVPFKMGTSL